ncbi:MAG TPA: exonuclease domain-containing protein [Thermomicrobiales bacterium]|jgi:DNA polymerase III epsilon subunit family exonuclease|nr:exonuclease domain-containing protein [Thermomicrobiales bacterium]
MQWTDETATDESAPVAAPPATTQYSSLIERALAFVRSKGGAVHEDLLIVHVFGNRGHVKMWRPLLRNSLASCDDLSLRADGYWIVSDLDQLPQPDRGPLLREFVAVDVETTGVRPISQRVIEIGAVRFRDGVEAGRFSTLVNPGRKVPKAITELTGIHDGDLADQPPFEQIAGDLVAFIGASVIAGHNVGFDIAFLDSELKRAGHQGLANERIDTVGLATRLLPGVGKPSLDRVARAVGLAGRDKHRAVVDAELCGNVALRLIDHARGSGVSDIDIVKAIANSANQRQKDGIGRGRAKLDRAMLKDIPKLPGVYLMHDRYDHVIYVGKAKNLRDRVGSYFSQPVGYTRKMDGLLENLHRIETVVVGSELEALLLESQLIRRYGPRYNTALRSSERYPYIRLDTANPFPRMTVVRDHAEDGARYFGPYRNTSGARRTVEFLNDVLPLRTCPRSFKDARSYGSPCIQLDLGKCLGPCTGKVERSEYRGLVTDVVSFLEGDEEVLFDRLQHGLTVAAEKLDFERAGRIRNDISAAQQIVRVQRQMNDATVHHTLLVVQPSPTPDAVEMILVVEGRRWAQVTASREAPDDAAIRLARAWDRYRLHGVPPLDNSAVDETAILNRWIHQHIGHDGLVPLGATMDDAVPEQIDWLALARHATGIDPAALTAPPPQPAVDEEEAQPVVEPADPDVAQRHPAGDFSS